MSAFRPDAIRNVSARLSLLLLVCLGLLVGFVIGTGLLRETADPPFTLPPLVPPPGPPPDPHACEDPPDAGPHAAVERRIRALRHEGKYAAAAKLAGILRSDAERAEQTLRRIDGLPKEDRQRLRKAEQRVGRATMAERVERMRERLAVQAELLGPEHADTLEAAVLLSELLLARGGPDDMDEAERLGVQALEARRRLLGLDHPDTLAAQTHLADLWRHRSRFAEAERELRNTLAAYDDVVDEHDLRKLACQYELAKVLEKRGQEAETGKWMRITLEAQQRALGHRHPDTLRTMNSLAVLLHEQADGKGPDEAAKLLREAEPLQREALEGRLAVLDEDDADTFKSMAQLAALLRKQKQPVEAEQWLRKALSGYEGSVGLRHWDTLRVMTTLMDLQYEDPSRRAEAMELCDKALTPCKAMLNDDRWEDRHTAVFAVAARLASVLEREGRLEDAEKMWAKVVELADALRTRAIGDVRDRAAIDSKLRLTELAIAHARVLTKLGRNEEAFNASERGRSRALLDLLMRDEREMIAQVRQQKPKAAGALDQCLNAEAKAREHLAQVEGAWMHRSMNLTADERREATEAIRRARAALREAQTRKMAQLQAAWPELDAASTDDIRKSLGSGDIMLSYLWSTNSVQLLVLDGASPQVQAITLAATKKDVEAMAEQVGRVREWLSSTKAAPGQDGVEVANRLYAKLLPREAWERARSAGRIIVLPHGPLNRLPLEALVVTKGAGPVQHQFVIDVAPPIVYAASGTAWRHLGQMRAAQRMRQQALSSTLSVLVLADPLFQTGPSPAGDAGPVDVVATRSQQTMDALFPTLAALPATGVEARAIEEAVLKAGGIVELLLGNNATVPRLQEAACKARFLQLATHGITGTAEDPYGAALALTRPQTPSANDIGYLRLEDLFQASWRNHLQDCEMVVLSACETQRGVEVGDCVMSLPWGFFHAGTPAVVASLWRVDDQSTAKLMGEFYRQMLGSGTRDKAQALRDAKHHLKNTPDYAHPYHWAAFVYLGRPE